MMYHVSGLVGLPHTTVEQDFSPRAADKQTVSTLVCLRLHPGNNRV